MCQGFKQFYTTLILINSSIHWLVWIMVADEGLYGLTMIITLNFMVCQLVKVYKTAITLPEELLYSKRSKSPQIVLRCFE